VAPLGTPFLGSKALKVFSLPYLYLSHKDLSPVTYCSKVSSFVGFTLDLDPKFSLVVRKDLVNPVYLEFLQCLEDIADKSSSLILFLVIYFLTSGVSLTALSFAT